MFTKHNYNCCYCKRIDNTKMNVIQYDECDWLVNLTVLRTDNDNTRTGLVVNDIT